jgi:hypothetical protein
MIKVDDFYKEFGNKEQEKIVSFGKVDSNYISGRPSLIFDGETAVTIKKYPYLSSYTPGANERVMLIKGVIVGKIV